MSAIDPVSIGQRIKQLRGSMTQQQFADAIGVGRVSVARYEGGARTPDAEFLAKLNSALGVDLLWLLTGAGSGAPAAGVGALTARERALLSNYKAAPEEGKRVIESAASFAAQPAGGSPAGRAKG